MRSKPLVFASACVGMLIFGISLLSMGALLPHIVARFQLTGVESGALVSLLPFGLLAGSMVFGPIVDRFGYKWLLVVSAALVIAGLETLAFASTVASLRLAIFGIGFGGGVLNGGTNALVADISAGERGAKLSLLGVFFGIGALGMPTVLGVLRDFEYVTTLALIGVVLCLPTAAFAFITFPAPKQAQGFPLAQGAGLLRDGTLILLGIALALQSGIEGVVNNWTTTFLQQSRGVAEQAALFALSAYVAGMTVARILLAGALRGLSHGRVLGIGFVFSSIGFTLIAFATSGAASAAGLALVGVGLSAGFPVMLGFVADLYPAITGTAFSVVLMIALPGNMAMNYVMGVLSSRVGIGAYPAWIGVCLTLEMVVVAIGLRAYTARVNAAR